MALKQEHHLLGRGRTGQRARDVQGTGRKWGWSRARGRGKRAFVGKCCRGERSRQGLQSKSGQTGQSLFFILLPGAPPRGDANQTRGARAADPWMRRARNNSSQRPGLGRIVSQHVVLPRAQIHFPRFYFYFIYPNPQTVNLCRPLLGAW